MPGKQQKYSKDNGFTFEDEYTFTDDLSYTTQPPKQEENFTFYVGEVPEEIKGEEPVKPGRKAAPVKQRKGMSKNLFLGLIISIVAVIFIIGTIVIINLGKPKAEEGNPTDQVTEQIAETTEINQVMSAAQKVSKAEFREILKNSGYEESKIDDILANDSTVDWKQNAKDRAALFLDNVGTNEKELRTNLDELGFTVEEIDAAIESVKDTDWNAQAVKRGELYLEKHVITKEQMQAILQEDGFTKEQSIYASENLPCDVEDSSSK